MTSPSGPSVAAAPSSITVVLVDAHHVLTEALTGRLEREDDLRVVGVADGPGAALDVVVSCRPDVVVVDLELDDSTELIARLRASYPGGLVLALTGRYDADTALRAMRRGAVGVVFKAAPVDDLVGAIRTAARGGVWLDQPLFDILMAGQPEPATTSRGRLSSLTDREREVLTLMVEGLSYAAIAQRLSLSVHTVRTHAHHLQSKLGVHSNVAAVALALGEGLRPADHDGEDRAAGSAGRS